MDIKGRLSRPDFSDCTATSNYWNAFWRCVQSGYMFVTVKYCCKMPLLNECNEIGCSGGKKK